MNKTDLDAIIAIGRRNASRLEKRKENKVKTTKKGTIAGRSSPIDDVTMLLAILDRVRIQEAVRESNSRLPKGA